MRKFSPCCLLLVLLALPLAGQTDAWKKYESAGGDFSILVPVEPQDTALPGPEGIQARLLVAQDNGIRFTLISASFAQEQPVDDANYAAYKAGVLSKLPNCEVGSEQQPSPALTGYIGHWYKLNCSASNNKITVEGNLYWGKHHSYAVLALFPASSEEPSSVKKFTGSFALLQSR
jgi:hypothetical protein